MFSYWEQSTWLERIDYCIVGSGIVGLSAALNIRRANPSSRILVIERSALPNGASTKNAGFACFGSLSELAADCTKMPFDDVVKLIEKRYSGLQLLRSELDDDALELQLLGGFEVFRKDDFETYKSALNVMDTFNRALKDFIPGEDVYFDASHQIEPMGLKNVDAMLFNRAEGQINTGKMMDALIRKVQSSNISIIFGMPILELVDEGSYVHLKTAEGNIKSSKVVIATNGFASQFLPELDVKPARAQVIVTSEIQDLQLKGTFHLDEGYYYFRNVGNRVLLGGGRNLDFEAETTTSHDTTPKIQRKLEELLDEVILPGKEYSIDYRWAGTMGLGEEKRPIVRQISSNLYCAVRMGGMGVALGSVAGKEVAELVLTH
jgi:glycine/D-amino acid oxidase-like deaminating enzyme